MLAASFFFVCMSVCVKLAAPHFAPLEIVFYRGLIGLLLTGALARAQGVRLATVYPWGHVWRNYRDGFLELCPLPAHDRCR